MPPKHGQAVQWQAELNTEDELQEWLESTTGLGIIDVYSEWCGPCVHMAPHLRRIKIEKAPNLALAIAKSDTIDSLRRFVGKSEPTWIFTANGQMVRLHRGVNYPRLEEVILTEIQKQEEADAGNDSRVYIPISKLTPEEQMVADVQEAEEKLRVKLEQEEEARKIEERRVEVGMAVAVECLDVTVLIIWPKFVNNLAKMSYLRSKIEEKSFDVDKRKTRQLNLDKIELFRKFAQFDLSDLATDSLLDGKAGIWLISYREASEENPIETAFVQALYAQFIEATDDEPKNIFESFIHTVPFPIEDEIEEETFEKDTEARHTNSSSASEEDEEEEEEEVPGEKCPGLWTPNEPIPLARATVLLSLFEDYVAPYIPPVVPPIPPHVAFIFPASESAIVMKTVKTNNFEDDILNYGFFSNDNPIDHKIVANSFVEYQYTQPHFPNEVFVLSVSYKRSLPSITLAELDPKYVSDNPKEGENDCSLWFGPDWEQGKEISEIREEEEGEDEFEDEAEGELENEAENELEDEDEDKEEQESIV